MLHILTKDYTTFFKQYKFNNFYACRYCKLWYNIYCVRKYTQI